MTGLRRTVGAVLVLVAGLLLGTGAPAPAGAHPFGDPQTVTVSGSGSTVVVEWRVGGVDDLTLLGIELGVLPADRVMLDGAVSYDEDDPVTVGSSDELRTYLLDRIAVEAAGSSCPGEVATVAEDLQRDGARLEFTCAAPVTAASVTVRMLTDLHPAYRTLATGPAGQRAVFDRSAETHEFDLPAGDLPAGVAAAEADDAAGPAQAEQDLGRSAALQLGAVLGALLLAALAGALLLRRRRRHDPSTTPSTNPEETTRVPTPASS